MSKETIKLEELERCLGTKKLKQLGILTCNTCQQILSQTIPLSLSDDLSSDKIKTANAPALLKLVPDNETNDSSMSSSSGDSDETLTVVTDSQISTSSTEDAASAENGGLPPSIDSILSSSFKIQSEDDFLKKLQTILTHTQPASLENLDMGYIYNYPTLPMPHSFICSECGRLYTICHPSLELLPLPVYLTDTEYEMLKGIYVDTLL